MNKLIDLQHPFFIPILRRIVVVLVLILWTVFEFTIGTPMIGIPLAAATLWCGYIFFFAFDPKDPEK